LLHNRPESDPAICIPYSTRSFIHSSTKYNSNLYNE
jgi:hypothetical protein